MGQFHPTMRPFAVVISESLTTLPIRMPAGSYLFHQGDSCNGLYILQTGKVDLLLESEFATKQLSQRVAPAVIGLSECISGEGRCSSAKVVQKCSLQFAPTEAVRELLQNNALVCMQAAALISDEIGCSLDLIKRCHPPRSGGCH